jgi:hypothetical protein
MKKESTKKSKLHFIRRKNYLRKGGELVVKFRMKRLLNRNDFEIAIGSKIKGAINSNNRIYIFKDKKLKLHNVPIEIAPIGEEEVEIGIELILS